MSRRFAARAQPAPWKGGAPRRPFLLPLNVLFLDPKSVWGESCRAGTYTL